MKIKIGDDIKLMYGTTPTVVQVDEISDRNGVIRIRFKYLGHTTSLALSPEELRASMAEAGIVKQLTEIEI